MSTAPARPAPPAVAPPKAEPPFDPTALVRRLRGFAERHRLDLKAAQRVHVAEGVIARLAAASDAFVLRGAWRLRAAPVAAVLPEASPAFWLDEPLTALRPALQSALSAHRADGVLIDTHVLDVDVTTTVHRREARVWVPARFGGVTGVWVSCWPGRPTAAAPCSWIGAAGQPLTVRAVAPAVALAEHLADLCAPEALRWSADDLWCVWRGLWSGETTLAAALEPLAEILARRGRTTEVLDRLRRRRLGQSRDSRRVWSALAAEEGRGTLPPLPDVVGWLADRLNEVLPARSPRQVQPPAPDALRAPKVAAR